MHWADGNLSIVFNGEIYNFRELRAELEAEGVVFRATTSDTEVLLALYARDRERMLPRLRGMFTLAIWDARTRELFLARDPYGIKPLYYAETPRGLVFASQVKAILGSRLVSPSPEPAGLAGFYLWGSVPGALDPLSWHPLASLRQLGFSSAMANLSPLPPSGGTSATTGAARKLPSHPPSYGEKSPPQSQTPHAPTSSPMFPSASSSPAASTQPPSPVSSLSSARRSKASPSASTSSPAATRMRSPSPPQSPLTTASSTTSAASAAPSSKPTSPPSSTPWTSPPSMASTPGSALPRLRPKRGYKVVLSGVGGDESSSTATPSCASSPSTASSPRAAHSPPSPGSRSLVRAATSVLAKGRHPKLKGIAGFMGSLEGVYFLKRCLFLPDELPLLMGESCAREGLARLAGSPPGILPRPTPYLHDAAGCLGLPRFHPLSAQSASARQRLGQHGALARTPHSAGRRRAAPRALHCPFRLRQCGMPAKRMLAHSPARPVTRLLRWPSTAPSLAFAVPMTEWLAAATESSCQTGLEHHPSARRHPERLLDSPLGPCRPRGMALPPCHHITHTRALCTCPRSVLELAGRHHLCK